MKACYKLKKKSTFVDKNNDKKCKIYIYFKYSN